LLWGEPGRLDEGVGSALVWLWFGFGLALVRLWFGFGSAGSGSAGSGSVRLRFGCSALFGWFGWFGFGWFGLRRLGSAWFGFGSAVRFRLVGLRSV
jgi:hypothetical protein